MEYTNLSYVLASVLFILGIKKLSHPKTARDGNFIAAFGMLIAIIATLISYGKIDFQMIAIGMIIGAIIGATFAIKVEMEIHFSRHPSQLTSFYEIVTLL